MNRKEHDDLESDKSETDERDKMEISDVLIRIDSKKKLIMILIKKKVKNNQREKIREKKAKKMI